MNAATSLLFVYYPATTKILRVSTVMTLAVISSTVYSAPPITFLMSDNRQSALTSDEKSITVRSKSDNILF